MLHQQTNLANPTAEQLSDARQQWEFYSKGDERIMTIRSILTVTRLSLDSRCLEEDIHEIQWLLGLGEILADMAVYDIER